MKFPDDFINKVICGDCLEILPLIPDGAVDAVITDPPYGVKLGKVDSHSRPAYDKIDDTEEFVQGVAVPIIKKSIEKFERVVLTPGTRCAFMYPQPREIGGVFSPAGAGIGRWGFVMIHPILYYGKDPHNQTKANGFRSTAIVEKNGHPCPKPIEWMRWLVDRASSPGEIVLDPFAGSGTTLVAAKQLGRKYIGIEISPEYCRIAEDRLRQGELFNETS